MVPRCDKCLNVNGTYVEVPCVPSATHVPRIHQNQNNVLGIRDYYHIFCNPFVLLEFNGRSTCPKNLSHHAVLKWTKETAVKCASMNVSYIYVTKTTGVYITLDVRALNKVHLYTARWMGYASATNSTAQRCIIPVPCQYLYSVRKANSAVNYTYDY
jgi:hypothetical protein